MGRLVGRGVRPSHGLQPVYLSQHFTEDILAGAFLGTVTAWAVHRWLYGQAMMDRTGLDRRPVGLLAQKK